MVGKKSFPRKTLCGNHRLGISKWNYFSDSGLPKFY